ncbi:hypothetical protein DMUE_4791 [Dictyocoela muelleri]|nr:hypothetical protein DMUE_4791 [Dictyocoela muelleri]
MLKILIPLILAADYPTNDSDMINYTQESYEKDNFIKSHSFILTLPYRTPKNHKKGISKQIKDTFKKINFTRSNTKINTPKNHPSNFKDPEMKNQTLEKFNEENNFYDSLDLLEEDHAERLCDKPYLFNSKTKNHINSPSYFPYQDIDSTKTNEYRRFNSSIYSQKQDDKSTFLIYEDISDDKSIYKTKSFCNDQSIENISVNPSSINQNSPLSNNFNILKLKRKSNTINTLFSGSNLPERVIKSRTIDKIEYENFQRYQNKFLKNQGILEIQKKLAEPEIKQNNYKRKGIPLPPIPTNKYEEIRSHPHEFKPEIPNFDLRVILEEISEIPSKNSQYKNIGIDEFLSKKYKKTNGHSFTLKSPNVVRDQLFKNRKKSKTINLVLFRSECNEISKKQKNNNDLKYEPVVKEDMKDYNDGYEIPKNFLCNLRSINYDKEGIYDYINELDLDYRPNRSIDHKLDDVSAYENILFSSEQNDEDQLKVLGDEYENNNSHGNIKENEKHSEKPPNNKTLVNEINGGEIEKNDFQLKDNEITHHYKRKFDQTINENINKKIGRNFDQKLKENLAIKQKNYVANDEFLPENPDMTFVKNSNDESNMIFCKNILSTDNKIYQSDKWNCLQTADKNGVGEFHNNINADINELNALETKSAYEKDIINDKKSFYTFTEEIKHPNSKEDKTRNFNDKKNPPKISKQKLNSSTLNNGGVKNWFPYILFGLVIVIFVIFLLKYCNN